jgi:hypothetical protein
MSKLKSGRWQSLPALTVQWALGSLAFLAWSLRPDDRPIAIRKKRRHHPSDNDATSMDGPSARYPVIGVNNRLVGAEISLS